jgi:hypothetical protein
LVSHPSTITASSIKVAPPNCCRLVKIWMCQKENRSDHKISAPQGPGSLSSSSRFLASSSSAAGTKEVKNGLFCVLDTTFTIHGSWFIRHGVYELCFFRRHDWPVITIHIGPEISVTQNVNPESKQRSMSQSKAEPKSKAWHRLLSHLEDPSFLKTGRWKTRSKSCQLHSDSWMLISCKPHCQH